MILERWVWERLCAAIKRQPVCLLLGARQVGKTTLALQVAQKIPSIYMDLQREEQRKLLENPERFLPRHRDKLVILDEIHHIPELFSHLRGFIDESRRQGKDAGQYLILGSAMQVLLRQTAESLTGRIAYVDMGGINAHEIPKDEESLYRLWFRGGYPKCFLEESDAVRHERLDDLIRAFLERDIPEFGPKLPVARLRRLMTMLSHLQGTQLNHSELGSNLGVDGKTVAAHLDLFERMLLARTLLPWHVNVGKRLVKKPRTYLRDSGVVHRLLQIGSFEDLMSHPIVGRSFEGFVIENLIAVSPPSTTAHYYRTASGSEIDLLLEVPGRGRWAIEVKLSLVPKIPVGFHHACRDVEATRKIVVCPGDIEYPTRGDVTVMSLQGLMGELVC